MTTTTTETLRHAVGEPTDQSGPAIQIQGLSKSYRRMGAGFPLRTLKSALLSRTLTSDLQPDETIPALRDLSFTVARGEAFGVIGGNGSGKSTLLKLVAGLIPPTAGSVLVDGRVAALIELGAGFHPEISGRENVYINGSVLGLSRREIDYRFDEILEFSGLQDFIDEPVKNYSSGMYVRLGFAVAIHTDPDVLLVDEVLSVGDEAFAHRCLSRIEEYLARGRTLLVVSHSLQLVEELCDRAVWLDRGAQRVIGEPRRVIDAYRESVAEEEGKRHRQHKETREEQEKAQEQRAPEPGEDTIAKDGDPLRWGSKQAEILRVRVVVDGTERYAVETGDDVVFEVHAVAHQPLEDFVFGIGVFTPRGVECWGTNTELDGMRPERFVGEGRIQLRCPNLRLAPGEYDIDFAVHTRDGAPYDYRRRLVRLSVSSSRERGVGVYLPPHRWAGDANVRWQAE